MKCLRVCCLDFAFHALGYGWSGGGLPWKRWEEFKLWCEPSPLLLNSLRFDSRDDFRACAGKPFEIILMLLIPLRRSLLLPSIGDNESSKLNGMSFSACSERSSSRLTLKDCWSSEANKILSLCLSVHADHVGVINIVAEGMMLVLLTACVLIAVSVFAPLVAFSARFCLKY